MDSVQCTMVLREGYRISAMDYQVFQTHVDNLMLIKCCTFMFLI